jgi:hypothetical protein
MGAVTWAIRQRPVSHPRSSNRTCRFSESAFPVDHITGECLVPRPATLSRARAHRRIGQYHGRPVDTFRGRSSLTSQAETCSKQIANIAAGMASSVVL